MHIRLGPLLGSGEGFGFQRSPLGVCSRLTWVLSELFLPLASFALNERIELDLVAFR
jgi:hypothetical protein